MIDFMPGKRKTSPTEWWLGMELVSSLSGVSLPQWLPYMFTGQFPCHAIQIIPTEIGKLQS